MAELKLQEQPNLAHRPDTVSTRLGHRFGYRVTSLLIDLDVADSNRCCSASPAALQFPGGMWAECTAGAAFNTGLASGKITVYTSPALSTRAKH
ncbi:hypothetical protein [Bradyrhizobium murdochi]|uniref:hypothetical protein n=1 Tax=Bradyrhizobium murdochi TaxID=1038859 RepID=UPI0003F744EE|nr:hypothetical protein [Bradyrhizobium murdochi]